MSILRRVAPLLWRIRQLQWRLLRPTVLGVKLMLIRDGQVLLVRHTYLPGWHLPGGGVRRYEGIEGAARREAREEIGATLHDLRLFGVYNERPRGKSGYVVALVSTSFEQAPVDCWEIAETRMAPLTDLPRGVDPGTRRRIEEYLRGDSGLLTRW